MATSLPDALQRTSPPAADSAAVRGASSGSRVAPDVDRRNIGTLTGTLVSLAALWAVIHQFTIESAAFSDLAALTFVGFAVHYFLPYRHRLTFFLLLSLAGIVLVLGGRQAAWLIGIGVSLIGICHLPVPRVIRVSLLLLVGLLLGVFRSGWLSVPVPASVWPILGSMFMFRLIVYVYDLRHDPRLATFPASLSYFFLLPNVCFPLFPVVDFKGYRKTYYNTDRHHIYQSGLQWMFRGVLQLLAYRVVYQTMVLDPVDVENVAELGQYLTWPFLLYLRVSGQFHMIVGMLKLFGFNLPETHHSYYLASSFTDFWRRINIYWKDFMMKLFYYPAFFALRKRGQVFALVASTVLVFLLTWLLHSYQWFWLRGVFMFTWNDALFWAILGVFVVFNALREWRSTQTRALAPRTLQWAPTLRLALRTMGMFCLISVLWSLWSAESMETWVSLWSATSEWPRTVRWTTLFCLSVPFLVGVAVVAKAREWTVPSPVGERNRALVVAATAACLVLASSHRLSGYFGPVGEVMLALRGGGLNQADAVALERGYYENLLAVDRFNGELAALYMNRPLDWGGGIVEEGLARRTEDARPYELLPFVEGRFKGATLRTNRWGLHDGDYEQTPQPGCFRIAVLGASHAMGSGVVRERTFEALLEARLNDEVPDACYEILNFAVYGYSPLVQPTVIERKMLAFEPDTVLYVGHPEDSLRVARYLSNVITARDVMPYTGLDEIVATAAVTSDMPARLVTQRLEHQGERILENLYARLTGVLRPRGICTGFVYMPMIPDMSYAVDVEREKDLARNAGFVVLDLSGVYDVPNRDDLWIAEWDAHPNAAGHALVAAKLYELLQQDTRLLNPCSTDAAAAEDPPLEH